MKAETLEPKRERISSDSTLYYRGAAQLQVLRTKSRFLYMKKLVHMRSSLIQFGRLHNVFGPGTSRKLAAHRSVN